MSKHRTTCLYLSLFISGAAILVLEILGTRVISPFYGTTIYVWTSLITVTLGALSLGYFLGGYFSDKHPTAKFFYLLFCIAGNLYIVIPKIDHFVLSHTDNFGMKAGPLVASVILFFLPLLLLGMLSPFGIKLLTSNFSKDIATKEIGKISGKVFAVSTLGSIFGGLLSGFYLLDKLSLSNSFVITGVILVFSGLLGYLLFNSKNSNKKGLSVILVMIVMFLTGLVSILPRYMYKDTYTLQIPYHDQSFYADLKIIEIGNFRCMAMNGAFQSCSNKNTLEPVFTFIAETERIVKQRKPKKMLLLGLGTGNVLHNLSSDMDIDVVEIDPKIVPISEEYFGLSDEYYTNLIFDDARHYMQNNDNKYDLILVDTFLGNSLPVHLFSKEGIELWKDNLTEEGLILLNLEGKLGADDTQIQTLMKTASTIFPSVMLTATEPDRYTSVLVHISNDPEYTFSGGGQFVVVPMDYSQAEVMLDDLNKLEIISLPKLEIFRNEMINVAGLKLLLST